MIRGVIYNLISRGLFILGGYIIHIYAGRSLGPEQYGSLGVVLSILTISYIFLNNGVRQTISKKIAISPESAKTIFYKGVYIQSIVALFVALIISGGAGYFTDFFNDQTLLVPLRFCGAVVLIQGLYFVCTGALNGLKLFFYENILICIYSIVKPVTVILFITIGLGVCGTVLGFFTASLCAATTGFIILLNTEGQSCDIKKRDLLQPVLTNIAIFACVAGLMNFDVLFIKKLVAENHFAGFYTASSAFAKTVYLFLFAFGAVALPLVSSSFKAKDLKQCKIYLSQLTRYSVIMFLPVVVIIAATSNELMIFFYTSVYASAGEPLQILSFGAFFAGMFSVFAHVLIAIGREKYTVALSVSIIAIDILLNLLLIPVYGMIGAAVATSVSAFLLLFFSGWTAIKNIGIDFKFISLCRITALVLWLYYIAGAGVLDIISLPVAYVVLYIGFGMGLLITREINKDDILVLKGLLIKNKVG